MYAHICSRQTPTSRARVRFAAIDSAIGAAAAEAVTAGGGIRSRRRASGTAAPATTTPQAAARRALDRRMEAAMLSSAADRACYRAILRLRAAVPGVRPTLMRTCVRAMVQPSDDVLAERICTLAAHIDAALCEWLELVAEFDQSRIWADWGATSCAAWLAFTCGMSQRTAREHVRVASRLAEFPTATEAFRHGELSYSKVRAITRLEDVSQESELVTLAQAASGAQLDRIVGAYQRCVRAEQPDVRRRFVSLDEEEDGMWTLRGRLGAEEAAVVNAALLAMRPQADRGGSGEPPSREDAPAVEDQESRATTGERTADALTAIAETALARGAAV
jgi:hypothetical protein